MVECVVEFEYVAEESDELTIHPGDIISNVRKLDGGWWEGDLNGKRGVFPDNFVKETKGEGKQEPKKPVEQNNRASQKKVGAGGAGAGGHVAELANKLGKEGAIRIRPPGSNVLRRDNSQGKKQQRVKATFSYSPENEDELSLEIGDIITVTKQEEEGWWEGILNGKQGMFPSNFVEVLDDDAGDKSQGEASGDELNTPEGEFVEIQGKKIKGIGLGNIFSAGPIKLRSTGPPPTVGSRAPPSPKSQPPKEPPVQESSEKRDSLKRGATPTEAPPNLPPKDPPVVKPLERARVLFSYTAENDDELTIDEGNIITVLDKDLEDSGWWKGEINGKTGVFPDNFVELLPPEEPQKPRKPPPPSTQPAKFKMDKGPMEPVKPAEPVKEEHRAETSAPHRGAPSVPAKKPAMPPPVGRKPAKPADAKLMAQTDDHKVKESQKDLNHLDSVEPTEKLNHPTANRARAPQRRLPSSVHNKEQGSPPPQPKKREDAEKRISRPAPPKVMRPPPPTPTKEEKPLDLPVTRPAPEPVSSMVTSPVGDSGVSIGAVEELRRELEHLKATTVPKRRFEEVQTELNTLKESVSHLKSTFNKKLLDLMTEIDEEKKIRLNMQVEIDRVKKLAMS